MEPLLKEVTLEGFKSFRDRTSLRFDGLFTAIVGPNGSGKSNVVDAVKWVLGDQSPRSVRATTGLEAIYRPVDLNGDEEAGFASIAIKIDNSKPENADEPATWEIERRYYRSGESIYTINGKTARLKDVRALMSAKGFGLGSLSVVGQGEIEGFLSLVPTDRRLVFEDLARISDFKANKRKILGRLEECARNHERLKDLIGEIGARVEVLAVQAEAARRHAELSSSAREIRAQLAAQEFLLAARNLERHVRRLEDLSSELDNSKKHRDEIVGELASAKQDLENAREESAVTLAECEEGRRELDGARAEERRLTEANRHLATLIGTLEEELSEREHRLDKLSARLTDLGEVVQRAEVERVDAQHRRLDYELHLSRRWGHMRACERERERLATRVERLQGEGSFFARDAEFHTRRAEALLQEATGVNEKISAIQAEIESLVSEISALDSRHKELRSVKHGNEKLLDALKGKHAVVASRRDNLAERRREIAGEIAALESEKKLLAELEASKEGYGEGVRAVLDRRDEFPGLRGTLGELIKVRQGRERVIERALGDALEFLVVDTLEQALRIIDTVRRDGLGLVTCVVRELVPSDIRTGQTGGLIESCSIDPELAVIPALFLQGAEETDDLGEVRSGNISRVLITSTGAVFRPPAFVSGGSETSGAKGILTRRARLEEMDRIAADRRWKSAALASEIHLLGREIAGLESELAAVGSVLDSIRIDLHTNSLSRQKKSERLESTARDLGDLEKRLGEVHVERQGCMENAGLASRGTEFVKRARVGAEQALEQLETELPGLSAQIEDLRSRVQRAIVEEASYKEEAGRARLDISRIEKETASEREEMSARRANLDRVRTEARGISGEYDSAVEKRTSLEERLPELERVEKNAGERIELLRRAVESTDLALEEARDKVAGMENAVHLQEVRLAEMRGGLVSLEKGLADFPEFAERIRSGELQGKDIPSKKELAESLGIVESDLQELGEVNPLAIEEERLARQRLDELKNEREDLLSAEEDLRKALEEVERQSERAFTATFNDARDRFAEVFTTLFPGGSAELALTDPDDPLESGIDVKVRFPGKGELDLLQFSGGEKSLIALALLFAILKVKPSSFTVLDEVEAALDDVNTQKFLDYLGHEFQDRQFIMITHNKITMERADRLYGVTMLEGGVSQVVSVDLKKLKEEGVEEALGKPN